MPRKTRDVLPQLRNKFHFIEAAGKATDHTWVELEIPGAPKVMTKFSHGKSEIEDKIIGKIARQLKVSGSQFSEMIDCTMSRDDYRKHVVDVAKADGTYREPK